MPNSHLEQFRDQQEERVADRAEIAFTCRIFVVTLDSGIIFS
jgi:hypothetical protein